MVQFKKPKKKKKSSMRKKEKLNLDALEAEAVAAGLGVGDLGSRNDWKREAIREEEERSEAERKSHAYQSAFAKAEETSKSLRMQLDTIEEDDEENTIVDDDEDLYKSLERARKLALKKKNEQRVSGPKALAATVLSTQAADNGAGEQHENQIVITEMEEFVGGLQLDEDTIILEKTGAALLMTGLQSRLVPPIGSVSCDEQCVSPAPYMRDLLCAILLLITKTRQGRCLYG